MIMLTVQRKIKRYGWRPGMPGAHALRFSHLNIVSPDNPPKVDLRGQMPAVYDQGELGSCTGNAWAGLIQYFLMKQHAQAFVPSRLFIYYNERAIEGTAAYDSGAAVADGARVLTNDGVPPESMWPYDINKFAEKPPAEDYKEALKFRVHNAQHLDNSNLNELKSCLASNRPFVFGFTVYQSFESQQVAKTGVVPMPTRHDAQVGGHAVCAVGYDDSIKRFIVRNSWGQWGLNGYFLFPYQYLTNTQLASDAWTIDGVNVTNQPSNDGNLWI